MGSVKKIIIVVIIIYIVNNFIRVNNIIRFNNVEKFENIINNNNHFKIIVVTYNPGIKFLKECLKSIEKQLYNNYDVCIIDDASTKESDLILNLLKEYKEKYNWKYLQSKINYGPCYSRNKAIEILNPNKDDIIVCVDGDDELYNEIVLDKLNDYYRDKNLLLTFGNYVDKHKNGVVKDNMRIKFRKGEIDNLIKKNNYRKYRFAFSHLKTFKFKLYNRIDKEDLKKNGEFIRSSTDIAIMLPMLEMAGKNIKFINDKLYKYTIDHQESFHTNINRKKKQKANDNYIRSLDMYEEVNFDKLFFIHIPKNAGTSIEYISKKNNILWGKDYQFNLTENEIENLLENKSIWHVPPKYLPTDNNPYKKYINFAIIRNPYDRIISEYKYYKNIENIKDYNINIFIKDIYHKYKENKFYYGCHFIPQSEFIYGYPKCDEILRFETLDSDFYNLLNKYKYRQMKLPQKNKSYGNTTIDSLNKDSIEIINKIYKDDFENFGYKLIDI